MTLGAALTTNTKLSIRLLETLEKAVVGFLAPWQIRREGRAKLDLQRDNQLVLEQTQRDIADIKRGRKRLTSDYHLIGIPSPEAESPLDRQSSGALEAMAQRNLIAERMRAELNVGKALLNASVELEEDEQEPPNRGVDDDWLLRWRESAGRVSSDTLQGLWGRVLAGEVKSPGTFSFRTLEFLKTLSQEEARQIEKIAPFVMDNDFIFEDEDLLNSQGITFRVLVELQDLGIVTQATRGIQKTMKSEEADRFSHRLIAYDHVLLVEHEDREKALHLKGYRLSSVGGQVVRLGTFTSHENYLRSVGMAIKQQGFEVQYARFEWSSETEGRWWDAERL